ncbi:ATP-binding cassette domain-containing protein [Lysinibacter sp. HNR]|nr:ATP-binding cassette domain-containing protein [Lysinibacter sp. HNR]WGD38647.1 ATP-binding cassette domain-containing protein [Lysinibacter sp. HNR]
MGAGSVGSSAGGSGIVGSGAGEAGVAGLSIREPGAAESGIAEPESAGLSVGDRGVAHEQVRDRRISRAEGHPPLGLAADVEVSRGDFNLSASLRVEGGEVVALLGPNGSGKSTLLAALAGFLPLDRGRISVAENTISSTDTRALRVPPYRRGIGLLEQDPGLFPHLTIRENVAFGPRSQGADRRESLALADRWLADVGLAGAGSAHPHELSGGQQQRVALARTFAARPGVILLDEPFASLDVATADDIRQLVGEQLAATNITALIVSHDIVDGFALASRSIVLDRGCVVEEASTPTLMVAPRSVFAARLVGLNRLEGVVSAEDAVIADVAEGVQGVEKLRQEAFCVLLPGGHRIVASRGVDTTPALGSEGTSAARLRPGHPATVLFHPGDVAISVNRADSASGTNSWRARVRGLSHTPRALTIRLSLVPQAGDINPAPTLIVAEVRMEDAALHGLRPGVTVWVSVEPSAVAIYPTYSLRPRESGALVTDTR